METQQESAARMTREKGPYSVKHLQARYDLSDREQRLIDRERRILRKPFISERTVQIMFETLSVLFSENPQ